MNHTIKLPHTQNPTSHRAVTPVLSDRIALVPDFTSKPTASPVPAESRAPHARVAADRLLSARPILKNPYFIDLENGAMTLGGFRHSQEQFFFAVRHFSRPLAALAARLPESASRLVLIHNLGEEHGEGDPAVAHDKTFERFLGSIGGRAGADAGPEVDAFNSALMGACLIGEIDAAFGCLGIIEYAFADISALIGNAVVARGWVRRENLVHYNLHAEIDKRHAEELFEVVESAAAADGLRSRAVARGLALGLHIFDRFYAELHRLSQLRSDES
jgi:pyrroloquinoline-quinone synthase